MTADRWGRQLPAGEMVLAKDNKDAGSNETLANGSEQGRQGTERNSESSREHRMRNLHHADETGEGKFSIGDIADETNAQAFVASAALIGIGALLEPELLGGMLLGAGAVYVSRGLPLIGGVLRPLVKTVVRVGYAAGAKASEMIAEASEEVQDMVAEARADYRGQQPPRETN